MNCIETWRGLKAISAWLRKGGAVVPKEQAAVRAVTCAKCPMNRRGLLWNLVTRTTADVIIAGLANEDRYALPAKIHTCKVCGCALRLKVRLPLTYAIFSETVEQISRYPAECWLTKELDQ
jgi:hypothetical protein